MRILPIILTTLVAAPLLSQEPRTFVKPPGSKQSEREAMYYRYLDFSSYVKGGTVEPHWLGDGDRFWHQDSTLTGSQGGRVVLVDPVRNTEHEAVGVERRDLLSSIPNTAETRAVPQAIANAGFGGRTAAEVPSPDGRWFATIRDHDLWLRPAGGGPARRLTTDGASKNQWVLLGPVGERPAWSPDSKRIALVKVDSRLMVERPLVHWLGAVETVEWKPFVNTLPEHPWPRSELHIFDIERGKRISVRIPDEDEQSLLSLSWLSDGSELTFLRALRRGGSVALVGANPKTGKTRVILREEDPRGILGALFFNESNLLYTPVVGRPGFIWLSDRSGLRQLYLYAMDGRLVRQLTTAGSPIVRVVAIDPKQGWVYYLAHADPRRPYDTQLLRVGMNGGEPRLLTPERGVHQPRFSPSLRFFLDTHSALDRAPRTDLRSADGTFLRTISQANTAALLATGWKPPEEFTAKAADGVTDLIGVLYRPNDFDPSRKYPVIEIIYAGALYDEVQHGFTHRHFGVMEFHGEHALALAQLGFVTFMVNARGTPNRDRDFQTFGHDSGRAAGVTADHYAVLQQLGRRFPFMDLDRVGLFGHSVGAFFTVHAMLLHPEVYKVGVAVAGGADSGSGGSPGGKDRAKGGDPENNLPLVEHLRGHLLVIAATSDMNVPFSSIMRLADAFARAGKLFDLIVMPGQGHFPSGYGMAYTRHAIRRYFEEHLKPQ